VAEHDEHRHEPFWVLSLRGNAAGLKTPPIISGDLITRPARALRAMNSHQ
jgi:hypothetical protein